MMSAQLAFGVVINIEEHLRSSSNSNKISEAKTRKGQLA
jgi:hypothetical protein